jgi:hypothetical protein
MTFHQPYPAQREPMLGPRALERAVMHELELGGRGLQVLDLARIVGGTEGVFLIRDIRPPHTIYAAMTGSEVGMWPSIRNPEPTAEAYIRSRVRREVMELGMYDGLTEKWYADRIDEPEQKDRADELLNPDPTPIETEE